MPKSVITFVFKVLRNGLCFRHFHVFAFSFCPVSVLGVFAFSRFRVFVFRRRHPRGRDTDFSCTVGKPIRNVHQEPVHCLFRLLGWKFAEGGAKAPPFSKTFCALGVSIDVTNMAAGEVKIDNTENRKKELCETIDLCLETKRLSRHDALKLRGRMQFTAGQVYGRVAKTCLGHVTMHAYSTKGAMLSLNTVNALTLYCDMLVNQGPRSLSRRSSHAWYFFTDASFEMEGNSPLSGYGGALVSPAGKPVRFFSGKLDERHVVLLNPKGSKTNLWMWISCSITCLQGLG